jgi:hypothetical protein
MVVLAGALLALAAVAVVVAGALLPATPTPSPTVIAVNGPPVPQSPGASAAPSGAPRGTSAVADAPGTVREGFVIVDQADHARLGPANPAPTTPAVARPLATGPMNSLDVNRLLILWPFLLAISLAAIAILARRAPLGVEEGAP